MNRKATIVWECEHLRGSSRIYTMRANKRLDKPHVNLLPDKFVRTGYVLDRERLPNGTLSWRVRYKGQNVAGADHVHHAMERAECLFLDALSQEGAAHGVTIRHPLLETDS